MIYLPIVVVALVPAPSALQAAGGPDPVLLVLGIVLAAAKLAGHLAEVPGQPALLGEQVGLIFANIGLGLSVGGRAVVEPQAYSAIVMMVIRTTLFAPAALKWRFKGRR